MRFASFCIACLVCVCGAACPAPSDVTPMIAVRPRAAQWFNYLHPPKLALPGVRARVHRMEDGEQLGGPSAVGRPGDLILENEAVVFVVDQLGSSTGFAESGGNLVDAADARLRKDELGQLFTYCGAFPRQGVYDTLSSGNDDDGSAWVEANGRELYEDKLAVTTRYTLAPGVRALLLETTLQNQGATPVALLSAGDVVQWGGAEKVAPGKPRGFRGASSGPYVGGVGRFASYAMTSTEGLVEAMSGSSWTDTSIRKGVSLAPGEKTTYARLFVIGEHADTASLAGELAQIAGQPVGGIQIQASGPLATGETLELRADGATEALSVASGEVERVPAGRYWASLRRVGAAPVGPAKVVAGAIAHLDIPVGPSSQIEVGCRLADGVGLPCKVTFEGLEGTASPDFGSAHAAGPARNQVTTLAAVKVRVAAGKYRIIASRGPEYSLDEARVEAHPGEERSLWLRPARVVDTRGYLACDFHQHTILGADAPVGTRDRVIANAAEGVEIAVASEHNVVASLQPLVQELGLTGELVALAGDELTSDASRHPWGHANAWPLTVDPSKAHGGAPVVRDRTPAEVFDELRRSPGGADIVLQVNHPRSGATGYFDLLGFDGGRGVGTHPSYDARFDAIEVWNGRNVDARARVLEDWCALLRTGHPITPTADTDTHGVVGQEAGYPRTYVRVSDDEHLESWDRARSADLARGVKSIRDVVLTNGPMLIVTAGGVRVGGMARGHSVTVKVHVEAAPWVDVDAVGVLRVSEGGREEKKSVKLAAPAGRPGVRVADVSFVMGFDSDDALFVVASGNRPMSPVMAAPDGGGRASTRPGGGAPANGGRNNDGSASAATASVDPELLPWAMTGAIWVDADGDGACLGR